MERNGSQDRTEEKISRLLSGLPVAEAPEDFEGSVRSRIAELRASRSDRPVFWLAVKFAGPMLLLVIIGAFLIFSDDSSLNVGMVPPVGAPRVGSADLSVDEPSNAAPISGGNLTRQSMPNRDATLPKTEPGSQEKALSPDDTTRFPPGVDPRRAVPTNQRPPTGGQISPSAILGMLGIGTACSDAGCKVVSIQPNSLASKIGLEVDDLIEAIDDRRIVAGRSFEGSVSVSSLLVLRAGKRSTVRVSGR